MTVLGEIDADGVGLALCHEHLFLDIRNQFRETAATPRGAAGKKVRRWHRGLLQGNPYALRDNLVLDDARTAGAEIDMVKRFGCATVVDCTPATIGGSPRLLRDVALCTGLNIIAGTGFYTQDTHPAELATWSVEQIADKIRKDLLEGIDDSGIRAGIIGEIGTSNPLTASEEKCLLASALAFRAAGSAIMVHTYPWAKEGVRAARLLLDHGVNPRKIVICHSDVVLDHDYIRALLALGVFVEFDNYGKEFPTNARTAAFAGGPFAQDSRRNEEVMSILDEGRARQLLLSNDVCLKSMLHSYGGRGYDHLLKSIIPALLKKGASQALIDTLLRENPKELLAR